MAQKIKASDYVSQPYIGSSERTRNKAIDPRLEAILASVAAETGVTFEVSSGGQDGKGEGSRRTGSTRHDHGNAADVKAKDANGNYIDFSTPQGQETWGRIVQLARAGGATGIGAGSGYMGNQTVHIGFGNPAVWSSIKSGQPVEPWLKEAYTAGTHTPPLNIPVVASSLDVGAPTPMPGRPASLSAPQSPNFDSTFGATAGDLESPLSRLSTTTLGWKDDAATWDGTDIRAPMDRSSYARARLEAGNVPGGVADPRIASLLQPQQETIPLPRARPPVAPVPMPGRPPMIDMVSDPDQMIGLGNGVGFGPNWDALNTLKDISAGVYDRPAPPVPMPGRPAFPGAPSAPVPMPGRPGALNNVAPPSVPAPRNDSAPAQQPQEMVRLPSGKMAPIGTQVNPETGNTITISRGPDGMGVVKIHRSGFIDIGSEMNAPTLAGALIRSKIPEAAQSAVQNFGPAMDNVKSSAVNAINTVAPTFQGLGNTVGGMFGGLMGMLPGSAPPKVPGSAFTGGWGSRPPAPMPFMPSPMLRSTRPPSLPAPRNNRPYSGPNVLDEVGALRYHG